MRNKYAISVAVFVLFSALFIVRSNAENSYIKRRYFGAKFEPVDRVLTGAGQQHKGLKELGYALGAGRRPLLFITYDDNGKASKSILNSVDWFVIPVMSFQFQWWAGCPEGGDCYKKLLTSKQRELEDRINTLASGIISLERPVFVRIGYEVNGKWNNYDGPTFVKLFRKVVTGLRNRGVNNFAALWNVDGAPDFSKVAKYYPGDEYVDWWSFDIWSGEGVLNSMSFCQEAAKHSKPVMIVESTARYRNLNIGDGQKHWEGFFKPYFEGIRQNPIIKGFCYINWDWRETRRWPEWGDARIEANKTVLENYRKEMDSPLYLHGTSRSDFENALQGGKLQRITTCLWPWEPRVDR